jgi:SAM-dependent methyltransferase
MKNFIKAIYDYFVKPIVRLIRPYKQNEKFIANDFGFSRGTPIDRWYIHKFFLDNASLIRGSCLEFGELAYLNKYGGNLNNNVIFNYSDIALLKNNEIAGDLTKYLHLPESKFDCIVCVNVINFIYDINAALQGLKKMLKDDGYLIITVAGPCAHISRFDMIRWGDYWRFTDKALEFYLTQGGFEVKKLISFGNPDSVNAQINGYCASDLSENSLSNNHEDYQLVICAVASKSI